jgi:hypothetical protein
MTIMNPSLPFPNPSEQSPNSHAKRKWTPPHLTIEQVTQTAGSKFTPIGEHTTVTHGGTFGPAS